MRHSSVYIFLFISALAALAALLIVHPAYTRDYFVQRNRAQLQLVRQYGLTDLCLFTEARYTRHISQADLNSAFQDHPFSFEHFPSGSIVGPPRQIIGYYPSPKGGPGNERQ